MDVVVSEDEFRESVLVNHRIVVICKGYLIRSIMIVVGDDTAGWTPRGRRSFWKMKWAKSPAEPRKNNGNRASSTDADTSSCDIGGTNNERCSFRSFCRIWVNLGGSVLTKTSTTVVVT